MFVKYKLIILFLLSFLINCADKELIINCIEREIMTVVYNDNPEPLKINGRLVKGKFVIGHRVLRYKDGQRHGLTEFFRTNDISNSDKYFEANYLSGQLNGKVKMWYSKQNQYFEINYKNNKKNGRFVVWSRNGDIKKETYFKDDSIVGPTKVYISPSNLLLSDSGNTIQDKVLRQALMDKNYLVNNDLNPNLYGVNSNITSISAISSVYSRMAKNAELHDGKRKYFKNGKLVDVKELPAEIEELIRKRISQ